MPVVRVVSFLLAAECLALLFFTPRGPGSFLLAAIFAVFFIIFCASVGAFARTTDSETTK